MALREFAAQFGIPASSRDVVTVSGYVFQVLGRIPERGTVVPLGKWQGTIEVVERRKVKTLRLTRAPEPPPQPARTISASGTKRKKKSV
jgi:CBS domain containing-hemolysin-like protein